MKFKENISYLFVEILTQNFQYAKIWTKIIFLVKKKRKTRMLYFISIITSPILTVVFVFLCELQLGQYI